MKDPIFPQRILIRDNTITSCDGLESCLVHSWFNLLKTPTKYSNHILQALFFISLHTECNTSENNIMGLKSSSLCLCEKFRTHHNIWNIIPFKTCFLAFFVCCGNIAWLTKIW